MNIKQVLSDHALWLKGKGGKRAELRFANLRDADLRFANLYKANLCDANLSGADLSRANLRDADLSGANLYKANLCDANLSGADLSRAILRDADLRFANLYKANLCDANLSGADLSRAILYKTDLSGAILSETDLSGFSIPIIKNIHEQVYAMASKDGVLDMSNWHRETLCGTRHCRGGCVVVLAGEEGKALEAQLGTNAAAALIYAVSDPKMGRTPNWFASNEDALADMKKMAEVA